MERPTPPRRCFDAAPRAHVHGAPSRSVRATLLAALLATASLAIGAERTSTAGRPSARAGAAPVLPVALRGAWFPATAEGRRDCASYLGHRTSNGDRTWDPLIGTVLIGPRLAHHVSEYGEGNFYEPVSIQPAGAGRWRLRSRLGIDTYGDPQAEIVESNVQLASGRLRWEHGDGDVAGPYVRCTTLLPPGHGR